jgi:uncharacterized delta-60 repeat protein
MARAYSIAIQKDGKIVVAGYVANNGFAGWRYDFALARYEQNGLPDSRFGVNGKVVTNIRGDDYGQSLALQRDGKIVVAGYSSTASGRNFTLARYMQNGTLDNTFGANGTVITDFGNVNTLGRSVAIQGDGKIVVAGGGSLVTENYYFATARYIGDYISVAIESDSDMADLRKANSNASLNIYLSPNPSKDVLFVSGLSSSQKQLL